VQVVLFNLLSLISRCESVSQNGAASGLLVWAYSPGHRRKKKPSRSMSAIAAPCDVWAV
jgi:hypothetical protein